MKILINKLKKLLALTTCLFILASTGFAQEDSKSDTKAVSAPVKAKPVKNTFQSIWIIDNQTTMVPVKHTLEIDIQHRFGTINNGYQDFYGFFSSSNIRLGVNYSPINKLNLGIGLTKNNMLVDGSAKYAIFSQTKNKFPVNISYYVNMAVNTKKDPTIYDGKDIKNGTDRLSFFHQLIISRKVTNKLSLQVAPSISHQNAVGGYYTKNDSTGKEIFKTMKNTHFAIAFSGRYKVTNVMSVMVNYDQPLTKHPAYNPDPNLSFGIEINTSSHSFQLFFGNYYYLSPQMNNLFNTNAPFSYTDETKTHPNRKDDNPNTPNDESTRVRGGRFLIGFNITRLWNY